MNAEKDIRDDEIRVIGGDDGQDKKPQGWKWLLLLLAGMILGVVIWQLKPEDPEPLPPDESTEQGYFDPVPQTMAQHIDKYPLSKAGEIGRGFVEMMDTTINDILMRVYIPHQMRFSLFVGDIDRNDPSILFATQAADVRADNGGIVGAFVLKGEPLSWGGSKKGFCAIINDTVTVGVAENSPLFEEATEKEGYFFRQFPLVDNGQLVDNELKGKNFRRALCDRNGEVFIVETLSTESLHDFAQALTDLGVDHAIYLLGGIAYGWATDAEGHRHEFGNPDPPKKKWENISYLVMKEKS